MKVIIGVEMKVKGLKVLCSAASLVYYQNTFNKENND